MSKLWKLVADEAPPPVMSVSSWSDSMVTDNAITMFAPPGVAFHCFICSKYTMAAKLPHTMWPAVPLLLLLPLREELSTTAKIMRATRKEHIIEDVNDTGKANEEPNDDDTI